jgi:RimJ/RimL family protein N-acetyltransferase
MIRSLDGDDSPALAEFVEGLSEDAIYNRFLTSGISREALLSELSPRPGCLSLIAVVGDRIVGLASYCRSGKETAEVGLLIDDAYQGKGLGTGLTEKIARAGNEDGISMFEAIIDWNNTKMIELVRKLGFPTSEKVEPQLIRIRFPTSIDPVTIEEFQERWVFHPT